MKLCPGCTEIVTDAADSRSRSAVSITLHTLYARAPQVRHTVVSRWLSMTRGRARAMMVIDAPDGLYAA